MKQIHRLTGRAVAGIRAVLTTASVLTAIALTVGLSESAVAQAKWARESAPAIAHERIPKTGEPRWKYEERQREIRDFKLRTGSSHFEDFESFVEQDIRPRMTVYGAYLPKERIYITAGLSTEESHLVRMYRIQGNGELLVREGFFRRGTPAAQVYADLFKGDGVASPLGLSLETEFNASVVVIDDALFHLPFAGGGPGKRPVPQPNLSFDGTRIGELLIQPNLDGHRDGKLVLKHFTLGKTPVWLAEIRKPATYAVPPPARTSASLREKAQLPFRSSDLSTLMLEGNTDARRELDDGVSQGHLSIAADFSRSFPPETATSLRDRIESAFSLRRGKAIAVIGHFEWNSDSFFVRVGNRKGASIGRTELLRLGETYGVDVLLLGCDSASVDPGSAFAGMTASVNSETVAKSLVRAASNATNWEHVIVGLSSAETPLLVGGVPSPRMSDEANNRAQLMRRLPDGRIYGVAWIHYQIGCRVLRRC